MSKIEKNSFLLNKPIIEQRRIHFQDLDSKVSKGTSALISLKLKERAENSKKKVKQRKLEKDQSLSQAHDKEDNSYKDEESTPKAIVYINHEGFVERMGKYISSLSHYRRK
jgi:hypothetical protein